MESRQKIAEIAPGFLKDFLPFISPKLFEIINIPELSIKISKMGFNFLFNSGVEERSRGLTKILPTNVELLSLSSEFSENSSITDKKFGETILELYFSQLKTSEPVFLDLRSERFNLGENKVFFETNGLYYHFSSTFRKGLAQVYEGFYLEKNDLFEQGLINIQLISPGDPGEVKAKIKELFSSHFGDALFGPIKFEMEEFQESFHQIFSYLYEQNKSLPTEFTFLGIYLVTLYMNLSSIDEVFDIKGAYLRSIT